MFSGTPFRMVQRMPGEYRIDFASNGAAWLGGIRSAWLSVFAYVLFGTYIGVGALAYDLNFSLLWVTLSTLLVWAGPAQVILISTLGSGAKLIEVAVAVGLSGVRLLPMVVSLMPILRGPQTRDVAADAAGAFHRGQHVGRVDAARAADAGRAAHSVLQRARLRLYVVGDDRDRRRLLPGGVVAGASDGGTAVPDADVVPGLDCPQLEPCWSTASR